MFRERMYGYGIGVAAGAATVGAALYPALAPWLVLLIVLCWAVRRRVATGDEQQTTDNGQRTNEYGEVWHE